jgi:pimeloyl-ACP methyl ester carboxylesterase
MNPKRHDIIFSPGWGFKDSILENILRVFFEDPNRKQNNNAVIIAWSLGGLYAIDLMYRFPEKYQKLILISSLPKFVSDKKSRWQGIPFKKALKFYHQSTLNLPHLMKDFLKWVQYPDNKPEVKKALENHMLSSTNIIQQQSLRNSLRILLTADSRVAYNGLSQKIFHIMGDCDAIIPVNTAKQLTGKVFVIPGAGHVSFLTHPEEFINIIREIYYDKYSDTKN